MKSNFDLEGAEHRIRQIKDRRTEINAILMEWKRAYFAEGISTPLNDRLSLVAEDAALAVEQRQIAPKAEQERVRRAQLVKASVLYHLKGLLMARGMCDLIAEAERLSAEELSKMGEA